MPCCACILSGSIFSTFRLGASERAGERCVCQWVRRRGLIGRRAQQECAWLLLSAGRVQTAQSSRGRVIVTGKSLHEQREPRPCQICGARENSFGGGSQQNSRE